jgi:hypothetical protein
MCPAFLRAARIVNTRVGGIERAIRLAEGEAFEDVKNLVSGAETPSQNELKSNPVTASRADCNALTGSAVISRLRDRPPRRPLLAPPYPPPCPSLLPSSRA